MPRIKQFALESADIATLRVPEQDPGVGAGVVQAVKGVASDINKQARTMIDQYDSSRSRESYNNFRESARQKITELKSLKGRDAVGASKDYRKWYEEENTKISGDLDNPIQQGQFGVWSQQRRDQDLDAISGHEAVQAEQYNLSVHAGELAHSQGDIMAHYADDNRIEGENGVIQGIKDSFARTYPGVDKSKEEQAAVANARALRIQLMAEDNPVQAEKLLEKHKVSLGPAYLTLKDQVKESTVRKESQVSADMIRSQHLGDYPAQLKSARAIDNSEVRDATVKRINERKTEDKRVEEESKQFSYDAATSELIAGRDAGMNKEQLYDLIGESLGGEGDTGARLKAEKLVDSWDKKLDAVDWDAVIEAQNEIDAAAADGDPVTNDSLTLNYGGLVGRKLPQLLARNTSARKNLSKAAFTRANENLKNLFKSKEFGNPKKSRAKARYAGLDTELNQFVEANPQGDPVEWLDARVKTYRQEKLAGDLNSWSDRLANISPFRESSRESLEKITDEGLVTEMLGGDTDDGLASRLAVEAGVSPEDLNPAFLERIKTSDEYIAARAESSVLTEKQIKKALASTEFQDFKLRKLQELEEINQ